MATVAVTPPAFGNGISLADLRKKAGAVALVADFIERHGRAFLFVQVGSGADAAAETAKTTATQSSSSRLARAVLSGTGPGVATSTTPPSPSGMAFGTISVAGAEDGAPGTITTTPGALGNGGPALQLPPAAVFPLVRRAGSQFDWVAVGRNEGNDVFLPHASVSRFHAFFRESSSSWTVQDARSSNGTFVGDARVQTHGDGPASAVANGNIVRFGDVAATFLSAEGLYAILTKLG